MMYEEEIKCPYCGSYCIVEYEPQYDDTEEIEEEIMYMYTCTECLKNF